MPETTELLAAGYYLGNIIPGQWGVGVASTGSSYVHLLFEVHSYKDGGQWVRFSPVRRTVQIWTTDKAIGTVDVPGMSRRKLEALGCNYEFDGELLFSNTGDIELSNQPKEYNGQMQEKWDMAPPGGGGWDHKEADASVKRSLKAKFGAHKRNAPPPSTKPAAPPPPTVAKPTEETPEVARERAWNELVAEYPKDDSDQLLTRWRTLLEKEFPGVDEADLAASDWRKFQKTIGIPF